MLIDEKTKEKSITWICIAAILVFFLFGVRAVIKKDIYYIFDWFFCSLIVGIGLWIHKKVRINYTMLVLGLIAVTLHQMKLYGKVFFGLNFDGLFHFYSVFVVSLLMFRYIHHTQRREEDALLRTAVIAFFVAVGIGSMLEIFEYFGYYFLGPGEGILFYGVGDYGEWANSAWDMTSNVIGAAFGCLLSYFFSRK